MIAIPEWIWSRALDEFARTSADVERVAFLDGLRLAGHDGVVTTLTLPDARLEPGWYEISAPAMSQAGVHFRDHSLARLAQVHTHAGADCRHSPRDDAMAYSVAVGAVSIVLPNHARDRPSPSDGCVHLRTSRGWRLLESSEARELVRLVPSYLDFRSTQWRVSPTGMRARLMGAWRRFRRRGGGSSS